MTRPEAMRLSREMYGRWSGEQIRSYLAEHGLEVCVSTVRRWGDPDRAEQRRIEERDRARERRQAARIYKRMCDLRERGMHYRDIAIVLSVDYGSEVDTEQVRYSMNAGRLSRGIWKAVTTS